MKQFGITTFAVLYALLIIGATAERSNAWAIQQAEAVAHPSTGPHSPAFNRVLQSETYLSQKKRVETEFAIEVPREADLVPSQSSRLVAMSSFEYHLNQSGQPNPSRSPPIQI